MATSYSTGTVSITNGSAALTGSGTAWVTNGVQAGDIFEANGLTIEIATVGSNTSVTLARAWPGSTISGNDYSIRFVPQATRVLTQTNALLAQLANGLLSGLSSVSSPAADKLAYLTGASTWGLINFKSWARTFLGAADQSAGRTALGLGTIATQDANNVAITGGSVRTPLVDVYGADPRLKVRSSGVGASSLDGDGPGLELTAYGMNTTAKYTPAVKFGSTDPELVTKNPKFMAAIVAQAATTYASDTDAGMHMSFWTTPIAPETGHGLVQRMIIRDDGKVGIGTSAPVGNFDVTDAAGAALHVSDTGRAVVLRSPTGSDLFGQVGMYGTSYPMQIGTSSYLDAITIDGTDGIATFKYGIEAPAGSAAAPSISKYGDTNTGIYFPASDTIAVVTGGSERLRLTNSGVSVGHNGTPLGGIDVSGRMLIQTAFAADTSRQGLIGTRHYDLAELPFYFLQGYVSEFSNTVYVGGGTGSGNAATELRMITASNTTTATGTTRMTINNSGNVSFSAYGAGTLSTDSSGNITASSDERLKTGIVPFTRGLDDVVEVGPISYNWTAASGLDQLNQYSGFSAQNVYAAIPEAIGFGEDGYMSVDLRPIVAALVNAVKTLKEQNEDLEARIEALEA